MRAVFVGLVATAAVLWTAGPALALADPADITLDDALARALKGNPAIRSAEIQLHEAQAAQKSAGAYYWKALSANIGVMPPLLGGTTWNNSGGVVLNFNLGDLLVTGPEGKRQAASQVDLAQQALARAELEVAAEVTGAHAAFEASRQVEALREASEHAADLDRQAIEREFAAGKVTGTDVRRAQLAWRQAAVDLAGARSDVLKSWAGLLAAIGDADALKLASSPGAATTLTAKGAGR